MLKVFFFVEFLLIKQMCGNTVRVNKNYEAIILFWTNSSIARYIISVLVQNLGDKNVKATQDDAVVQTVTNNNIILSFNNNIIPCCTYIIH